MAEEYAKNNQYQYTANSNLVLKADRSALPRRGNEPTGEPESLWGHIDLKDMGSHAVREQAPVQSPRKRKNKDTSRASKPRGRSAVHRQSARFYNARAAVGQTSAVLSAAEDFEGLVYHPKTIETRRVLDLILAFIHPYLSDQPQAVIRSAADSIIEVLKNEALRDPERQKEVAAILNTKAFAPEQFAKLVQLGKGITDYLETGDESARGASGDGSALPEDTLDEELGVAVVFDQEDEDAATDASQAESTYSEAEASDDDRMPIIGLDAKGAGDEGSDQEPSSSDNEVSDTERPETVTTQRPRDVTKAGQESAVDLRDIDAFWLPRTLARHYTDPHVVQEKANACMQLLATPDLSVRECENQLMELFDYDHFDLVKLLTQNRDAVYWCTELARTQGQSELHQQLRAEITRRGLGWILTALEPEAPVSDVNATAAAMDVDTAAEVPQSPVAKPGPRSTVRGAVAPRPPQKLLDLEALAFSQGGHLMSNRKCKLPEGSFKRTKRGYEEIHVPAPKPAPFAEDEALVPITALPEWAQSAFAGNKSLNRVQSRVYPTAFQSDENALVCAPTGAGKTNVAMLTMLRAIHHFQDPATQVIDVDSFKIVYIAPMKALVSEMVGNFSNRLQHFGIKVAELTGDVQLTKQQIAETQVIVTTPEKWDVITRKATDRSYTNLVRLIIIDEIHLLHDDRGPVLESIVSRTLRTVEQTKEPVRLIGLSATLPNYEDVAAFLRVDPRRGLFHFDSSFRPCPLRQEFVGIMEKKPIKRLQLMNEVTYEKVADQAGRNQVLVFVHSRKETFKTAQAIRDMALEKETIGLFLRHDSASREVLQSEAETVKDPMLKELLPYGFAIHHAGLDRTDRTLVEELFADGHVQVLVSTATLAWGVNLPAHTVIIKGTQVYNPEKGSWMELSPQDVLQMLGRAGRPQFDTYGEGIIITAHAELQYYLSLMNQQLPIESQLVARLPDILNAEVVLGTIRSREEAAKWLGYSYLYVRMLKNPALYGVQYENDGTTDGSDDDQTLWQKRIDLAHSAATVLEKSRLIKYDKRTGKIQVTDLGRIASHYYISHVSMATYDRYMHPGMSQIELFRLFALSGEFKFIPVREEEKLELNKLLERVPIPVKEGVDEPTTKINVLLQAYISQLKLEGFALVSDMVYVTQSAGRILRALYEICLKYRWALLAHRTLELCKMVERRMWLSMTPLRQFRFLPCDLLRKLERKGISWDRYYDMDPQELGELVMNTKAGAVLHKCIHQVPRLTVSAHVQPVTRSLLRFELTLTPDFLWDERVHGQAESFWILVEDVDGEEVLYHEQFVLKQRYAQDEHVTMFTVPLTEPMPPNYFVTVLSDRWLYSETKLPVSFRHLLLPDKYLPPTELLDMQALPPSALRDARYEQVYTQRRGIRVFNPVQTQVFNTLYLTDHNVFLGAPTGSGKTLCAELALIRFWNTTDGAREVDNKGRVHKLRAVYLAPYADIIRTRLQDWRSTFGAIDGPDGQPRVFEALTGELAADLKLLDRADVVLATPAQWDVVSRRWMQRRTVQSVGLVLADELHTLGSVVGPTYEVVLSRMRFMASQTERLVRLVGLGSSLANAKDMADWLGVPANALFNFNPLVRPVPLEISIQSYKVPHFPSLMLAMARPTYLALQACSTNQNGLVFVPSRKQCRLTAAELLALAAADDQEDQFLGCAVDTMESYLSHVQDSTLAELLRHGIGYYHENLSKSDQALVTALFRDGALRVVVASRETCWGLALQAHLVVIMGTQYYEGREHRYADYSMPDVLQMMGLACRPLADDNGRCVLMCQANKKEFYKKFLYEPLPIESHLDHALHDHFNAAVVTRTIENYQDAVDFLTWTFLYRRLTKNPNYYGLQGVSPTHLSDHLSELVESTLQDLAATKCIAVEDETQVTPLNLGMIAAYYNISYLTIETLSISLTETTKLRGLLEIITAAAEFEPITVRHHEDALLRRIYDRVPCKLNKPPNFRSGHTKCFVLLQAHFSRMQLPPDLASDQTQILAKMIPLIQACVDVLSSHGWLKPAMEAMELAQMCVQAQWNTESPLKQIPNFARELIQQAKAMGAESVFDVMEMTDEDRQQLLASLAPRQVAQVADFVNRYPEIEVVYELADPDDIVCDQPATLQVGLERDMGEGDEGDGEQQGASAASGPTNKPSGTNPAQHVVGPVIAPYYPFTKDEGWWVVLGDPKTQTLASIKRVNFQERVAVKLEFVAPSEPGEHQFMLYVMSDSFVGCDQEFEIAFQAQPDEEEEESDDAGADSDAMSASGSE